MAALQKERPSVGGPCAPPASRDEGTQYVYGVEEQRSRPGWIGRQMMSAKILTSGARSLGDAILDHLRPNQVADVVSARRSRMEPVRGVASHPNGS
jgi:hypothetical protein